MPRQWLIVTTIACMMLPAACKRSRVASGPARSLGSGSVSRNGKTAWFVIEGNGVPVVVWADTSGSSSGSSGDGRVQGLIRRRDGKSVALEYRANANTMTIEGVSYDLANGAIFLLYSAPSPPRVVQLRHGPLQSADPVKAINDLARDDPEVRQFLQETNATTRASTATAP